MADTVQVDYQGLRSVAQKFEEQHQKMHRLAHELTHTVQNLKRGGWISDAANDFYRDMDNVLLPRLNRLERALHSSAKTAEEIGRIMRGGEEEATGTVKSSGMGGIGGGIAGAINSILDNMGTAGGGIGGAVGGGIAGAINDILNGEGAASGGIGSEAAGANASGDPIGASESAAAGDGSVSKAVEGAAAGDGSVSNAAGGGVGGAARAAVNEALGGGAASGGGSSGGGGGGSSTGGGAGSNLNTSGQGQVIRSADTSNPTDSAAGQKSSEGLSSQREEKVSKNH